MKIHAITVAAGNGTRFGSATPKQFLPIGGTPVAIRAVMALRKAIPTLTDTIVLAETQVDRWLDLCRRHNISSPAIAIGGDTRFDSVRNALATVDPAADVVLVHDGARPFPSADMIRRIVEAFERGDVDGAIPAIPVTDSIRKTTGGETSVKVDRSLLRAVQTPQAFIRQRLLQAYLLASDGHLFTDDASVMENAGFNRLALVDGDVCNIKITNPVDIDVAEAILRHIQ